MFNIYKKHSALLALFVVLTISASAQMKMMYSDTVKPFSGPSAFRKFSFGINAGALYSAAVMGSNDYSNPEFSLGYGANLKYQFIHWFALQADFLRGDVKGNNDKELGNGRFPPARSFETSIHYAGSLNGVFTFNNINWLRMKAWVVPYLSLGGGIASYDVEINRTSNDAPNFVYPANSPIREFFLQAAGGLRFPLTRSLNLDLGYRAHFVDGDNFDGKSYYTNNFRLGTEPGRQLHKDKFSYAFLGLEIALGNKNKPQLMWDNPAARLNSYLQNQIDPVDSHGVSKDTDGDGVVDCKDQQLITPTECQPVDANGVGKCPPPACCSNMAVATPMTPTGCTVGDLPSLSFKGNSNMLSADAKAILASVASKLKESAECTITISGYPSASKASQAMCNKRTEAIRMYLRNNEGISSDRLNVNCEIGGGDANTVDLKVK